MLPSYPDDFMLPTKEMIFEQDVVENPRDGLAQVYAHLDVDNVAPPEIETKYNDRASDALLYARYYAPRLARRVFQVVPALHRLPSPRIEVTDEDHGWLDELDRTENERLEVLLGRSLADWRTAPLERLA